MPKTIYKSLLLTVIILLLALLTGVLIVTRHAIAQNGSAPDAALAPTGLVASPYIGETTPTSVVVAWATDTSGASEVRYSEDTSYSHTAAATSFASDGKTWHSATITGLTPDTTYHYRVYTGGVDLTPWSDVTFTTAPPDTATQVTFAALGDGRPNSTSASPNQAAWDVAYQMTQKNFDFAVHSGDIVYGGGVCSGSDSGWNQYLRAYFDVYEDSVKQTPFYPAIGNHELGSGSSACGYHAYTDVYHLPENAPSGDEERYYAFDWGNVHVISLNTEQNYNVGSAQYNWLENDLQNTDRRWIVVAFHRPPYSSGPHGSNTDVQDQLVPLFEQYGVDVVLNGHDHDYERTCPIKNDACTTIDDGGVVYFVTGGAGAPLYSQNDPNAWFTAKYSKSHHFMLLSVNDCQMNIQAIDDNGNVIDSYQIDKCLGNFAPSDSISIAGGDDVQLSWQNVTQDSNGKAIDVVKYYVYRDTTPYLGENATLADTVNGPFGSTVTWTDANHIGDSAVNYFYYGRSVVLDGQKEMLSEVSNHTGEFDFTLTPGD